MKIKFALLVPGAVALALSLSPLLAAHAQTPSGSPTQAAPGRRMPKNDLGLSEQQKAQMKALHESTQAKIEAVLNDTQKAQLQAMRDAKKAAKQSGQRQAGQKRQGWQSLNLSAEQQAAIRQIREDAKQQMQALLTPEQRQRMEQRRQEWQQRRQNGAQRPGQVAPGATTGL